ncbi:AraC family transcriptional regulator [Vibrio aestuarianus]|uniref:helix-turn-helix transcriptional regulator n=1 Tax=Vibrio aestuarianus TaxID=28171 RepID=UPI001559C00E|nr:helix-turn-helix transcriptional regulator [Vibrio aestuarianus]NGZ15281.1 AraC family transcriptional regulator [Vibrio aestuarianus]NKZ51429.1 AraC family transcriptional regulator [Vibrio aestuarianus]
MIRKYRQDQRYYFHYGWFNLLTQTAHHYGIDLDSIDSYREMLVLGKDNPDIRLARELQNELIKQSRYDFSIDAAKYVTPFTFGSFSVALWSAPTLHQCLELLCEHFIILTPQADISLHQIGEVTELWITNSQTPESYSITQVGISLMVCVILEILRQLNKGEVLPCRIYAPHHNYSKDLVDKFCQTYQVSSIEKSPIRKITFKTQQLQQPSPFANPQLLEHNLTWIQERTAKLNLNDIRLQVSLVLDELPTLRNVTSTLVAQKLFTSPRTLNRRLSYAQTNFKAILNNYRLQKALTLLQDPDNNMTEIAFQLGFSELSCFTRAFKRWTGEAPSSIK